MAYPGGKGGAGVFQALINQIPPHRVYLEPFLGGGTVALKKRRANRNIVVDKDHTILDDRAYPGFELQCGCGIAFLDDWSCWTGQEFVYCDPPYMFETRTKKKIYRFEMSDADHEYFLDVARTIPAPVMISGYRSNLYVEALADWRLITFQAMTWGGLREECLWMNYPEPPELHDYRYLGADFRERERITRKKNRWAARLKKMPRLERLAMMEVLRNSDAAGSLYPASLDESDPLSTVPAGLDAADRSSSVLAV